MACFCADVPLRTSSLSPFDLRQETTDDHALQHLIISDGDTFTQLLHCRHVVAYLLI